MNVAAEAKGLLARISDKFLTTMLTLHWSHAKPYILRRYPIAELQAKDMVKTMERALKGRGRVPVGAGVAAYTNEYNPEPVDGVLPVDEVLNSMGQYIDPLFNKINVEGQI